MKRLKDDKYEFSITHLMKFVVDDCWFKSPYLIQHKMKIFSGNYTCVKK